jgi:hypothetical protein
MSLSLSLEMGGRPTEQAAAASGGTVAPSAARRILHLGILTVLVVLLFRVDTTLISQTTRQMSSQNAGYDTVNITAGGRKQAKVARKRFRQRSAAGSSSASPYQPVMLPLFPWETASANLDKKERSCRPPETNSSDRIPNECCLGSTSSGGGVTFKASVCLNSAETHHRVANYTAHFLDQYRPMQSAVVLVPDQSTQSGSQRKRGEARWLTRSNERRYTKLKLPPQDCDICRIVDYLLIYNWTMSFQGDSVTAQTFQGLECELHRRGYNVHKSVQAFPDQPEGLGWRYVVSRVETLTISRTLSSEEGLISPQTAKINFYGVYRPPKDFDRIHRIVQSSDILVFDHGLHWTQDEGGAFQEAMEQLLDSISKSSHPGFAINSQHDGNLTIDTEEAKIPEGGLKLVAWRQTSSQHYNLPGGHYREGEVDWTDKCVPSGPDEGFRLPLLKAASVKTNYTMLDAFDAEFQKLPRQSKDELVLLPFRDYTKPLHYLHPGECTHYCHDPHVWLPIWRSLRIAVDRAARLYSDDLKNRVQQDSSGRAPPTAQQ